MFATLLLVSLLLGCPVDADSDEVRDTGDTDVEVDGDADGWTVAAGDCDDADASVNPDAAETCNGVDDDCDGATDDEQPDVTGGSTFFVDADGDGYGDDAVTVEACVAPTGAVAIGGDCDDADATVSPGAVETCDGADDDCDGFADEGLPTSTFYGDGDGDGFGDASSAVVDCAAPSGHVSAGTDCDDADPAVHPGATETCDGRDEDCDGTADDGVPTSTWYADGDGDGYGDPSTGVTTCEAAPTGYVSEGSDCDDADPAVHPAATETCDGADEDCDGTADDGLTKTTWYADLDGDGYGDAGTTARTCDGAPSGYIAVGGDCEDGDAAIHPGATEDCATSDDEDCDGLAATDPECVEVCDSGADEDLDGLIDCDDSDCVGPCPEDDCEDGLDDDGDGDTDCDDAGCAEPCPESDCADGTDDDGDGYTDCDDAGCDDDPSCYESDCGDGVDNDGNGLLDCEDAACVDDDACLELSCADGLDDESDGLIDCDDDDCWGSDDCGDVVAVVRSGSGVVSREMAYVYWASVGRVEWTGQTVGTFASVTGSAAVLPDTASTWTRCDWAVDTVYFSRRWTRRGASYRLVSSTVNILRYGFDVDSGCALRTSQFLPQTLTARSSWDVLTEDGGAWYVGSILDRTSTARIFPATHTGGTSGSTTGASWTVELEAGDVFGECATGAKTVLFHDRDGDGYGDPHNAIATCGGSVSGSVTIDGDCDDGDATVSPAEDEVCLDAVDDDCDGFLACARGSTEADAVWSGASTGDAAGAALALGDLDGDGVVDLVAGAPDSDGGALDGGSAYVVFGSLGTSASLSTADLQLDGSIAYDDVGGSLAVGDLDGDGQDDLVVADSGSYTAWILGGPVAGTDTLSWADATWSHTEAFGVDVASDLDGDGLDELLFHDSSGVAILLGGPLASGDVSVDADVSLSPASAATTGAAGLGDTDGDGLGDLALGYVQFSATVGANVGSVVVYAGDSSGSLGTATLGTLGSDTDQADTTFGTELAGGDADGDGYADLWITDAHADRDGAAFLFGGSASGFGTTETATVIVSGWEHSLGDPLAVGDLDGDGTPDLAVGSWVFLGPFSGTHAIAEAAYQIPSSGDLVAGDVDGDGLDDLVAGDSASDEISLFLGSSLF